MAKLFALALCLVTLSAFAHNDLDRAPNAFGNFQFVDFTDAQYHIEYDFDQKQVNVESIITFNALKNAQVLFDSNPDIESATLDGNSIDIITASAPQNATTYRATKSNVEAGEHVLVLKSKITELVNFTTSGVLSAFWMSDLSDKSYLERYLPVNVEFDRVPMTFVVEFINSPSEQRIYTNGDVTKLGHNFFKINFPEKFTVSSLFFHTAVKGHFDEKTINYSTADQKNITITVYRSKGSDLDSFLRESVKVLNELEADYGAWHHGNITIYGAGMGGMEYCGATMTSLSALGHELAHSYFARGVMPARGNSGWIDEAIASWRDNNYPRSRSLGWWSSTMAGHSEYRRFTDRAAYSQGARFMAYLDSSLSAKGGLKPFLKEYKNKWLFKPYWTSDFINELEAYSGEDYSDLFNEYIYGKNDKNKIKESTEHNPNHPVLSYEYYYELL